MSEHLLAEISKLVASEREREGPPSDVAARLHERLAASIATLPFEPDGSDGGDDGSGAGGATGGDAGPSVPASGLMNSLAVGATILVVGLGAGVAIDRALLADPQPQIVYVDRVVAPAASTAPTAADRAPIPSFRTSERPRLVTPAASATATPGHDYGLANERALLEAARTSLGRSDPATSLASLDRHRTLYPRGHLREEREAMAVQALASLGRTAEARARAERFKKQYPTSLFLPVVDAVQER